MQIRDFPPARDAVEGSAWEIYVGGEIPPRDN